MKLLLLLSIGALTGCSSITAAAGLSWSPEVYTLEIGGLYEHNLADGAVISLDWADASDVACFPATENTNFSGSHVFFGLTQPANTFLTVAAAPAPGVDISLYMLQMPTDLFLVPPGDLTGVMSCEDSFDYVSDANPGEIEYVEAAGYASDVNVLIGVAGANELAEGSFELELWSEAQNN